MKERKVWAVVYCLGMLDSPLVAGYFSDKVTADSFSELNRFGPRQKVVPTFLWRENGNWFDVAKNVVEVHSATNSDSSTDQPVK